MPTAEHLTSHTRTAVGPTASPPLTTAWQRPEQAGVSEESQVEACDHAFSLHPETRRTFETFFEEYKMLAYNFIRYVIGDEEGEAAARHTADVFTKVYLGYAKRPTESQGVWLLQLCVAEAETIVNLKRPVGARLRTVTQGIADRIPFLHKSPATIGNLGQKEESITRMLSSLHPRDRMITALRDVFSLTYQEIGEVLGLNPGQVKSEIMQTREAFRRLYPMSV